jgi:hypothetical protein
MTDVEAAEKIIRDLTEKRARVAARTQEIAEERKPLAIAVHVDGDQKARKRLDTLNAEAATISSELEGLDAAIAEADARLTAAQRVTAENEARANATELLGLCRALSAHGARLDDVMSSLRKEAEAFRGALNEIHARGCNFPSYALADVNARAALLTALMSTPWKIEHLAPGQRRTFGEIVDGWVSRIEENFVSKHLKPAQICATNDEVAA